MTNHFKRELLNNIKRVKRFRKIVLKADASPKELLERALLELGFIEDPLRETPTWIDGKGGKVEIPKGALVEGVITGYKWQKELEEYAFARAEGLEPPPPKEFKAIAFWFDGGIRVILCVEGKGDTKKAVESLAKELWQHTR